MRKVILVRYVVGSALTLAVVLWYSRGKNCFTGARIVSLHAHQSATSLLSESNRKAVQTEAQYSTELYVLSKRMYFTSAYSDCRNGASHIVIISYGSKSFDSSLVCKHGASIFRSRLTWINYPSEELATWRAGCVLCEIPGLADQPILDITLGCDKNQDCLEVTVPVFTAPLQKTIGNVGVCVKSAYGSPDAARLVEWLEWYILLGIDQVVLYDMGIEGPARKVMKLYADRGFLTVVDDSFTQKLASAQPTFAGLFSKFNSTGATGDEPYAQMELLSIQDCFYRHRAKFEYIMVADIDEVLIPKATFTVPQLLEELKRKQPQATTFAFQSAYYLQDFGVAQATLPRHAHTLRYTRRSEVKWDTSKAIHSTADTALINWHKRIYPSERKNALHVDSSDAWMHHYRGGCKSSSCQATVSDDGLTIVGKYISALTANTKGALTTLGMLHDYSD